MAGRRRAALHRRDGWHEPFFVLGSGGSARLVTPEPTGSLLAGITRDSLLQLATGAGFAADGAQIDIEESRKGGAAGEITEVFACGTFAIPTVGWPDSAKSLLPSRFRLVSCPWSRCGRTMICSVRVKLRGGASWRK